MDGEDRWLRLKGNEHFRPQPNPLFDGGRFVCCCQKLLPEVKKQAALAATPRLAV